MAEGVRELSPEAVAALLGSEDFRKVSTETWREVQGRVAALLPDDLSVELNRYYSVLQTLLTLLAFRDRDRVRANRALVQMHSELLGMQFAGTRNPWIDYLKATLDAQNRARARITEYLTLRWDDPLLQRVRRWVQSRRTPSQQERGATG